MKHFKWVYSVVMAVLLSACASTDNVEYTQIKRPLTSDFALAMSLLERPIPQDQQMMLAFAKQQEAQWGYQHYVSILGDKNSSPKPINETVLFSQISKDVNAIAIVARD